MMNPLRNRMSHREQLAADWIAVAARAMKILEPATALSRIIRPRSAIEQIFQLVLDLLFFHIEPVIGLLL